MERILADTSDEGSQNDRGIGLSRLTLKTGFLDDLSLV